MNGGEIVLIMSLLLGSLLASGCAPQDEQGPINRNLRTTKMQIGTEQFTLEIADDDQTRATGLMNRKSMPANHGMIFVFPQEQWLSFYMKNTHIPLDIIYLDAGGVVVSIHPMQPRDLRSVASRAPAKYAIELNQGAAARVGVRPGDRLVVPPEAAHTDR